MKDNFNSLIITINKEILTIALNRPTKRNALNAGLVGDLYDVLLSAKSNDKIRSIIITGNGSSFCSGADLSYLRDMLNYSDEENLSDSMKLMELFYLIFRHPKPVIALVNGPAIAGGAGLAICCDYVIMSSEGKIGFPEVKIGFVPAIVSGFLIQQIGDRKARELLLSGAIKSAKEALDYGLVNSVYHSEQEKEETLKNFIEHTHNSSPSSIKHTKELLSNHLEGIFYRQLVINAKKNAEFRREEDFKIGISSFLNKTDPYWKKK